MAHQVPLPPPMSQHTPIQRFEANAAKIASQNSLIGPAAEALAPFRRESKPAVNKLITKSDLPRTMQPHHWRHIFSGGLSFVLSVAVGVILSEVHHRWPREVHWQDGSIEKNYKRGFAQLPPVGAQIQIGIMDDGTIAWKAFGIPIKAENAIK